MFDDKKQLKDLKKVIETLLHKKAPNIGAFFKSS
jgi:hypothetical protein